MNKLMLAATALISTSLGYDFVSGEVKTNETF